ncbi:MAG TPA: hypothetical protein PLS53_16695 [Thermoanaerobaculaceae bacterium]|nr:hypothetical protein [Thermoanaerobaculaceae bacterium]HPS79800.1 hypothetical protein [Thermoanaerobaculaceae bacterium]
MKPLTDRELQVAEARLNELQTDEAAVEIECSAASAELSAALRGERLTADERGAMLLAGQPVPARVPVPQLEAQVIGLRDRRRTLEAACRLQKEKTTSIRVALTRKALPELQSEHDKILLRQLAAALELHRARKASRVWRAKAAELGYTIDSVGELNGAAAYVHGLTGMVRSFGARGLISQGEMQSLLAEVEPPLPPVEAPGGPAVNLHQAALVNAARSGVVLGGGR